jgi:hypothetical protein
MLQALDPAQICERQLVFERLHASPRLALLQQPLCRANSEFNQGIKLAGVAVTECFRRVHVQPDDLREAIMQLATLSKWLDQRRSA